MQTALPEENGNDERNFKTRDAKGAGDIVSFFDINQLELAFINRAIDQRDGKKKPSFVQIGRTKKILLLQKSNLEKLLRKLGREHRDSSLEEELNRILSGERVMSIMCFAPIFDT